MASVNYSGKQLFNGGQVNPDLQKERDTATFDMDTLKHYLNGGVEKYKRKLELAEMLFNEPEMRLDPDIIKTDVERYELAFKRTNKMITLAMQHGWVREDLEEAFQLIRVGLTIGVHGSMFIPALERLSTPEQAARWVPQAYSLKMLGTYCQTELGHGTNLRGLETTASYDATTQEFILNSTKLSGMKWWPGGLGKTCNHVLLLAQLRIGNKNCGMQPFLVKIRDMDTHMPLPGVEVGDIGARIGLKYADNGFLLLNDVRIPRSNMLMKNAQVTPEGKFVSRVSSKANYGTMVMMRSRIVGWAYGYMSMCATISTRYSAVRRQSELQPGSQEPQVLDYFVQQYKVFPAIAETYAVYFAQKFMLERYQHLDETEIKFNNFKSLPELHSLSCGLKSFCTELSVSASEICRRACGGHGYLLTSGIAGLVLDGMASVTYEGENTVLYLQTARYLMREFSSIVSGESSSGTWSYLSESYPPCTIRHTDDCNDLVQLTMAFKRMAHYIVRSVAEQLQRLLESGLPQYEAWNQMSVHLVQATKAHMEAVMVITFVNSVLGLPLPDNVQVVMKRLCVLYAVHRIHENSGYFLESGAFSRDQIRMLRQHEVDLLKLIRPDAVSLVDAFGHLDETLCSALGSYDGNAYERLYEAAKNSAVNKHQVAPGFIQYMKPLQTMSKL